MDTAAVAIYIIYEVEYFGNMRDKTIPHRLTPSVIYIYTPYKLIIFIKTNLMGTHRGTPNIITYTNRYIGIKFQMNNRRVEAKSLVKFL